MHVCPVNRPGGGGRVAESRLKTGRTKEQTDGRRKSAIQGNMVRNQGEAQDVVGETSRIGNSAEGLGDGVY